MSALGAQNAFSRRKSADALKEDMALASIGIYNMLMMTLVNGASLQQMDVQDMFYQLLKENENGFSTSFYSASESDTGDGRLALQTLAELLNGDGFTYSEEEVEYLKNDPELAHKLNGAIHLLTDSFSKELSLNGQSSLIDEYLYDLMTNNIVIPGDGLSDQEVDLYSRFVVNSQLVLASFKSLYDAYLGKENGYEIQIGFQKGPDPLCRALVELMPHYVSKGVDLEDAVKSYCSRDFAEDEFVVIEKDSLLKSFKAYQNREVGDEALGRLSELAAFALSYSPVTNNLKFSDCDPKQLWKETFIRLMRITFDFIGSAEDKKK